MRWLALAVGSFILAISILANTPLGRDISRVMRVLPGGDLSGHFLLTGLLGFFVVMGFAGLRLGKRPLGALRCGLIVAALVTLDELLQLALPRRSFSLVDLAASYAGLLVFGLLAGWLQRSPAPSSPGPETET